MSEHDPTDARLAAIFSAIDTRPDFNARFMDRLEREVAAEAERARQALQLEQLRHGAARQELRSWRHWTRSVSRIVTLERVGIAVLAAGALSSVWSLDQIRQYLPLLVTAVGLLLAFAPAVAPTLLKHK